MSFLRNPKHMAHCLGTDWRPATPMAFNRVSIDSRKVADGDLFVALKGDRSDGHDYLPAAMQAGALGCLVSREPEPGPRLGAMLRVDSVEEALRKLAREARRRFPGTLVGITGSCGKTSTREFLKALLGSGQCYSNPANWNSQIGLPLTFLGLDHQLHRWAVIEAGISEPGDMSFLAPMVQPDHAILTNVQSAHLEGLGSVEGIAREKVKLAEAVRPGGMVVAPAEVARFECWARLPNLRLVNFQGSSLPDRTLTTHRHPIRAHIEPEPGSSATHRVQLDFGGGRAYTFSLPAMTPGMRRNAALALVMALELGLPATRLAETAAGWHAPAGRAQWLWTGHRHILADHYNANPASMLDGAQAFAERFPEGGRVWILGGMRELGSQSEELHESIAYAIPTQPGDQVVLVGQEFDSAARIFAQRLGAESVLQSPDLDGLKSWRPPDYWPVMMKGSRAYALERLIPVLEAAPVQTTQRSTYAKLVG